jgi:aryl-alcohol dehydrogenase
MTGKFPFNQLLTFYEFDELDRAIQDVASGKVVKPVLVNSQHHEPFGPHQPTA